MDGGGWRRPRSPARERGGAGAIPPIRSAPAERRAQPGLDGRAPASGGCAPGKTRLESCTSISAIAVSNIQLANRQERELSIDLRPVERIHHPVACHY